MYTSYVYIYIRINKILKSSIVIKHFSHGPLQFCTNKTAYHDELVGYDGKPTSESVRMPVSRTSTGPSSSQHNCFEKKRIGRKFA